MVSMSFTGTPSSKQALGRTCGPPRDHPEAGDQLLDEEWLCEVIVRPEIQAFEEAQYEPTTCPLEPGCGEWLVQAALRLLNELKP